MEQLSTLRGRFGSKVFVTYLPDGVQVPWRPLDIGEFLDFQNTLATGQYARAFIEDEIFRKCVLDSALVSNIDRLKAGTVSTVTATIMAYSGPQDAEELNFAIDFSRQLSSQVLHQMVPVICQAFPAYTPEVVYNMDYETFMMRLAMAESRLIATGQLAEPISFSAPGDQPQRRSGADRVQDKTLKSLWEEQSTPPVTPPVAPPVKPKPKRRVTHTPQQPDTVITTQDVAEHTIAYTGHEMEDRILLEHDMVKSTSPVYKDYQEQIARGEKVRIKSVKERLAEAKIRMDRNKARYDEAMKHKNKQHESLTDLVTAAASKKK